MTNAERVTVEIVRRGTARIFTIPQPDGAWRWFVQGRKGIGGRVPDRDALVRAISAIR